MEEIISCPHCNEFIIINELNCKIFRHGVFKVTGVQIPPHSEKKMCDELANNGDIYGCGKPFKIDVINGKWVVSICEYI